MSPEALAVFFIDQLARLRWLVTLVHNLVQRHVQSACPLLKRFDGRHGVAIFDAGDVTAEQAGGLFDVALAEVFSFAECFESWSDLHSKEIVYQTLERSKWPGDKPLAFAGHKISL